MTHPEESGEDRMAETMGTRKTMETGKLLIHQICRCENLLMLDTLNLRDEAAQLYKNIGMFALDTRKMFRSSGTTKLPSNQAIKQSNALQPQSIMSIFLYDEEEVFPLSFANSHIDRHMTSAAPEGNGAFIYDTMPPPLLAESPNGLELSDTELDDEMVYQQQLMGSPLLYTSERLSSSPRQYKKSEFLIAKPDASTLTSALTNVESHFPTTGGDSTVSAGVSIDEEFADAAQQSYRLWLQSV